jgi:hypothetical protein
MFIIVVAGFSLACWAALASNPGMFVLGLVVAFAGSFIHGANVHKKTLKFDDGWSPNLEGDYRLIKGPDGLYVVGHGLLFPVDSYEESQDVIRELREKEKRQ